MLSKYDYPFLMFVPVTSVYMEPCSLYLLWYIELSLLGIDAAGKVESLKTILEQHLEMRPVIHQLMVKSTFTNISGTLYLFRKMTALLNSSHFYVVGVNCNAIVHR